MKDTCKPINVLDMQGWDLIKESTDCEAYKTARKLFDDVQDSIVLVETGNKAYPRLPSQAHVGTGFFVNDGTEIVTNAHVAAIDSYVNVITNDGRTFAARIEKIDENDDLALLKVVGIEKDPDRALKPGSSDQLKKEDELLAFGRPDGYDEVVVSPGQFLNRKPLIDLVGDPNRFPDLAKMIKLGKETSDPELKKEVEEYVNSERLHARMNIHHANSGSPLLDEKGELKGVVANRVSGAHSLMIPVEKVKELLNNPESKYDFEYESSSQNEKLLSIKRKDGKETPPVVLHALVSPMQSNVMPLYFTFPPVNEIDDKKAPKPKK